MSVLNDTGFVDCIRCKHHFDLDLVKLQYYKLGRIFLCPKCSNKMTLMKIVKNKKEGIK